MGHTRQVSLSGAGIGTLGGHAAVSEVDLGATAALHGAGRPHLHKIRPADGGVGRLDGLEELQGVHEAGVGAVVDLGLEADRALHCISIMVRYICIFSIKDYTNRWHLRCQWSHRRCQSRATPGGSNSTKDIR